MFEYTFWGIINDVFLLFLSLIIYGLIPFMILSALIFSLPGGLKKYFVFREKHPNLYTLIWLVIGVVVIWNMGLEDFQLSYPDLYKFIYEYFLTT